MNDAVTIAVRRRPLSPEEQAKNEKLIDFEILNKNVIAFDNQTFVFDKILDVKCSQEQIYEDLVQPMIGKIMQGFYCTILAYGQSGTGKSYTMGLQAAEENFENAGLVSRAIGDLLAKSDPNSSQMHVSFIEIYTDKAFDLLGENPLEQINVKGHKFAGATKKQVSELSDAQQVLRNVSKNRRVRGTKMNSNSSRSHAIFTIHVEINRESVSTKSALHLVDLAGSEGVRRTSHTGAALLEGNHINQGLLCISKVIKAMSEGAKVIPYRDSVLTTVLQDSLNANSYLTLLACITPFRKDYSETMSTLRIARNAKTMKTTPQINAIIEEYKKSKTPVKIFKTPLLPKNRIQTPLFKKTNFITSTANISATKRPSSRFSSPTHSASKRITLSKYASSCRSRQSADTPGARRISKQPTQIKLFTENVNSDLNVTKIVPYEDSMECTFMDESTCMTTTIEKNDVLNVTPVPCEAHASSPEVKTKEPARPNATATIPLHANLQNGFSLSPIVRQCVEKIRMEIGIEMKDVIQDAMQNVMNTFHQTIIDTRSNYTALQPQHDLTLSRALPSALILNKTRVTTIDLDSSSQRKAPSHGCFKRPATPDYNWNQRPNDVVRTEHQEDTISSELCSFSNKSTITSEATPPIEYATSIICVDDVDDSVESEPTNVTQSTTSSCRSVRLSMRSNSTTSTTTKASNSANLRSVSKTIHSQNQPILRRSTRLSIISETNGLPERSPMADITKQGNNINQPQKPAIKQKLMIENALKNIQNAKTQNQAKAKHKQYVLNILNTGDLKAIRNLSQIGEKTAGQILIHRTINGQFKDIDALSKLSCWRGKRFSHFLECNNLD